MTKTDLASEPSRLTYPRPPNEPEPKPHDEAQEQKSFSQQEPEIGNYKPEPTLPKDELDLPQAPRPPPSIGTSDRPLREYLTRREAAEYIRDELGRPMSFSTAAKLAAQGEFAPAALWWGRRPLYRRDDLRPRAEARSRLTKEHALSGVVDGDHRNASTPVARRIKPQQGAS